MNCSKLSLIVMAVSFALSTNASANQKSPTPSQMKDDAWATFSGEIVKVNADSFMLNYGQGTLRVAVDDGDFDNDAYKFIEGDKVNVTGKIDQGLFSYTTLDASSVYVEGINTTFFEKDMDDQDRAVNYISAYAPLQDDKIVVTGKVTSISTHTNTLTIAMGDERLEVDLSDLGFNALDDEGYLKIDSGDRVKITASVELAFFDDYDLSAEQVVKLEG